MTPRELETLAERIYRAIWRDILRALEILRNGGWLPAVERLLLDRNLPGAFRAVGLEELQNALGRIPERLLPLRNAGWEVAAGELPKTLRASNFVRTALPAYALERPDVQRAIATQDLSRIQAISRETQEALREIIARGLRDGTHPTKLAREIRNQVGLNRRQASAVTRYRARLVQAGRTPEAVDRLTARYARQQLNERARAIARTEVIRAQSEGRRLQWERLVEEGRIARDDWEQEWLTARDERTCPTCGPMHGQRQPIGQPFDSDVGPIAAPPVHPNCVLPGTLVSASPRITASTERMYRGEVYRLRTAGGKELACTPNHPVLTWRGWIPARLLHVGDDLICHRVAEGIAVARHDDEGAPPCIEEVAEAFRSAGGVSAREVPVTAPDFHGDGEGSEVAVVRADLLLGDGDEAPIGQESAETVFVGGAVRGAFLSGARPPEELRVGHAPSAGCGMCGRDLAGPSGRTHPGPAESLGVRLIAWRPVMVSQPRQDDPTGNPDRLGYAEHRFSGVEPTQDVEIIEGEARPSATQRLAARDAVVLKETMDPMPLHAEAFSDLGKGEPFPVEPDRLLGIERGEWTGHVYNLETAGGWYGANGIITHNCRCTVRLVRRGFRQGEDPTPARDRILQGL